MGSIKPIFIKRVGNELIKRYPEKFKEDFDHNKKQVQESIERSEVECPSKGVRNKLAGYIVTAVRKKKKEIK